MLELESPDKDAAFTEALARARARLQPRRGPERILPTIAAALFFALAAITFATAAMLAPPAQLTPIAEDPGPA
jgi:hypothetical protein